MSSTFLRRAGIVVFGGGAYAATAVLAYNYLTLGKQDEEETQRQLAQQIGFSFVQNPNRVERFREIAETYDSQIGRDETITGINLLRRALLYFHAKGTVLEVGAGTGRNLSFYPSAVQRVVLIDSSDKMLQQARLKVQSLIPSERARFAFIEGDASILSFPDNSFDCVVDTFGLCSFDDPVAVLREISRVCKPDGKILLLEHGRSKSWQALSDYLDRNAERHAKNWGIVWNRDLDQLLKEAPLNVRQLNTWHFGTTYYVVCQPNKATQDRNPEILATSSSTSCVQDSSATKLVNGITLSRNGEGIRSLNFLGFNVNIYIAQFWTARQLQSCEDVLACNMPKQMDFTFLRSVDQSGVTTAWRRQLDASVSFKYDDYEQHRDAFVNMFGPIKSGGTQSVIIVGDETHIIDQGVNMGIIHGNNFQRAFLSMWFGEESVCPELKTGLLGVERIKGVA